MSKVYLAGPFFNDEQVQTLSRIEDICKANKVEYFSPRLECYCPPHANQEVRENAFCMNVAGIENAPYVLARIDDFDPGTMWEMGAAYMAGVDTYAFTTVESRGLNLMLAQSGVRLIQGWEKLEKFLAGDTSVAVYWKKEIV